MNPVAPKEPIANPVSPADASAIFARNLSWLFLFIAVASAALCLAWPHLVSANSLNAHWPDILFLVTCAVSLCLNLARHLPRINVLVVAVIVTIFGGAVEMIGVQTNLPFGPFQYNRDFDPLLFGLIVLPAPLIWVAMLFATRGVARLILRPWRKVTSYGFWLIGVTATLVILTDVALEPFGSFAHHYWIWEHTKIPLTWYGAPLVNFLSWGFIALMMLAFTTPLLINKQLSRKNVPDFFPLIIWVLMMVVFSGAMAEIGAWRGVLVNGVITAVTVGFALAGSRW